MEEKIFMEVSGSAQESDDLPEGPVLREGVSGYRIGEQPHLRRRGRPLLVYHQSLNDCPYRGERYPANSVFTSPTLP
jgi:hypothetical protein